MEPEGFLFLQRFAWPCAGRKWETGKINEKEFNTLRFLIVDEKKSVSLVFFTKCFPQVVKEYGDYCNDLNFEADFSIQSVIAFLEAKHSNRGPCSFKSAIVCLVDNNGNIIGVCEGKTHTFRNPFGIKVKTKDRIFVHYFTAIGKAN